jgi:hypothetical protein
VYIQYPTGQPRAFVQPHQPIVSWLLRGALRLKADAVILYFNH